MGDRLCDTPDTVLSRSRSGLDIIDQRDPPIVKNMRNGVNHTMVKERNIAHEEGDMLKEQEGDDILSSRPGDNDNCDQIRLSPTTIPG